MKKQKLILITALLLSFTSVISLAADTPQLDEHLQFLQPLMEHEWKGGYADGDNSGVVIFLKFESVVGGKGVRYNREAPALNNVTETHFYWHPEKKEVCFISLNSRGFVSEGTAWAEDGSIILQSKSYSATDMREFKTIWKLNSEGKLTDTFFRKENGEWIQGHIQEFKTK